MKIKRDSLSWAVIGLLIGIIIGSGATWLWQKNTSDRARSELEKVSKAIVIRKNIDRTYESIFQLSDEYIKVCNSYYQDSNSNAANEMELLRVRLIVQKMNYTSQEKLLSSIESRAPRQIELDFASMPNIKPSTGQICSVPKPKKHANNASGQ